MRLRMYPTSERSGSLARRGGQFTKRVRAGLDELAPVRQQLTDPLLACSFTRRASASA
jgi:hypothetical protein